MKVLVVGDDLMQALDIMDALVSGGHAPVGPALDGMGAMHFAERCQPDLALVDLLLPDGEQGLDIVRELHTRFGVPALFLAASCEEARACGSCALGCIQKPIYETMLLRSITAAEQIVNGQHPHAMPGNVELFQ